MRKASVRAVMFSLSNLDLFMASTKMPALGAPCARVLGPLARPPPPPPLHRRLSALTNLRNFHATRAGAALADPSEAVLLASADVEAAVQFGCAALGRHAGAAEQALAGRLRDNWYATAADLAAMSDAQAAALGVPLRLRDAIADTLAPASLPSAPNGDSLQGLALSDAAAELVGVALQQAANSPRGRSGGAARAADEQPGWESLPIEERICPPLNRKGFSMSAAKKATKRGKITRYALSEEELTPALRAELDQLFAFGTQRFFGAQADPVLPVTATKYQDHVRGMLGWLHRERGVPLEELSLKTAVPSAGRDGVALAFDYIQWLTTQRGVGVRTEGLVLRSIMATAKFLYHAESASQPSSGDKAYGDLAVVKELRALSNAARKAGKVAARCSDESVKWLAWDEVLALVRELRRECAARLPNGRRRADTDVAWSVQRYLIFGILSCVPDRQRTIRELEIGRTLVQEGGRWLIKHGPGDYKTGGHYGERPPLVIAPALYPELEAFISTWRAALEPGHGLLFTNRNGTPLTGQSLYELFRKTAFRLTGKRTNPHLLRDSVVTYLRSAGNASERELEALALYMGHSMDMQRSSYDRRTKQEKVEPAVSLLEALNARARGGAPAEAG